MIDEQNTTPATDAVDVDAPATEAEPTAGPETKTDPESQTEAETQTDDAAEGTAEVVAGDRSAPSDGEPAQVFDGKKEGFIDDEEPVTREGMDWFVLRVASNKESSVQNTLLRKIQIEGMTHLVGRILVPTEKTRTIKAGKQRIQETKLYPGYVFVEMALEDGRIPQDVFFLIKETTGVGDFIGTAGRPTPLAKHEIEKMLVDSKKPDDEPLTTLRFSKGDNVSIKEGPFENYDGTVDEIFPEKGMVRVLVTIFGRQAPVDLEEWQIAPADEA
ncbi:MAG: transcription termination/antitermination protein NusG [Planctomycetota bacterium]